MMKYINKFNISCNHPISYIMLELFKELILNTFEQNIPQNILNILGNIKIFDNDNNRTIINNFDYMCGLDKNVK